MALVDLLKLEGNKVSNRIEDYSLLITGVSGIGKTPLIAELYGESALILSFENSDKGLAGVNSVKIDSYSTLMYYVGQLENPAVREKFSTIVIDTLSLLDYMCEKSVCDAYGVDLLGDCLKWNKAYKIVDKRFLEVLKRLQAMNYTMVYVCHPVEKKVKVIDKDNKQVEITKVESKVSDRVATWLIPEVDVRLYAAYNETGERVIYTKATPFFDARVRPCDMPFSIPFNATALREEFKKAIDKKTDSKYLVEELESKNISSSVGDFTTIINQVIELGKELESAGHFDAAMEIVNKELGKDDEGNQRTLQNATASMTPALETIKIKLIELKNKIK